MKPNATVSPIAIPAILSNTPDGSTAVAKKTSTRKNVITASIVTALLASIVTLTVGAPRWRFLTTGGRTNFRSSAATVAPASCTAAVEDRERRRDPAGDEEPEGDRRVEVAAGDLGERADHHEDGEAVGERADDRIAVDQRAGADEDEAEGADELGEASPDQVGARHPGRIAPSPDGTALARASPPANRAPRPWRAHAAGPSGRRHACRSRGASVDAREPPRERDEPLPARSTPRTRSTGIRGARRRSRARARRTSRSSSRSATRPATGAT